VRTGRNSRSRSRSEQGLLDLNAGDTVVMITDGVTDARNDHEEEFGEDH
jgi:serine phosphatase RsbU (regulator of sigma subunit)